MKKLIAIISIISSMTIFGATNDNKGEAKISDPVVKTETKTINYPNGVTEKIVTSTEKTENSMIQNISITSSYKAPKLSEEQEEIEKMHQKFLQEKEVTVLSIKENAIKLQKELAKTNPNLKEINKLVDDTSKLHAKLIKDKIALEVKADKILNNK